MLKALVKFLWWLNRQIRSRAMLFFFRCTQGTFFERIGRRVVFFGQIRFGSVEGNIQLGDGCWVGHEVFLSASKGSRIEVGDKVSFNTGCHLVAVYGIQIGAGTRIGEYCSLRDQHHVFADPEVPVHKQGFRGAPICLGQDVWVGRGTFIGSGVTIGDGCVIGANSVVIRDLPPYSIAVGTPARVIGSRKTMVE